MTYVEFFDKNTIENIAACLTEAPERVVLIGGKIKTIKRYIKNYERIFSERGYQIEFIPRAASKNDLEKAVELLTEIVQSYEDCVFDITGGEEIFMLALGIIHERYRDKNIRIKKFGVRNNVLHDCENGDQIEKQAAPHLSVEECVRIYGGDISYGAIDESKTYRWQLTDDFKQDVDCIWSLCRGNVRLWNTQIGVLEMMEKVGTVSADGLTTTASISTLETQLSRYRSSYKIINGIISPLCRYGLITGFSEDAMTLTVSYKNAQVKKCLTRAGQALEMKIYLTAEALTEENGERIYHDALNGVVIDWDGSFHDEETEDVYDTENEIDVMLMHDMIPVFVSCKNGIVDADELYKLNTVAGRFGGEYAKRVLVATAIPKDTEAGRYLRQRIRDMNITLVENVQYMDEDELAKVLKNLWCG